MRLRLPLPSNGIRAAAALRHGVGNIVYKVDHFPSPINPQDMSLERCVSVLNTTDITCTSRLKFILKIWNTEQFWTKANLKPKQTLTHTHLHMCTHSYTDPAGCLESDMLTHTLFGKPGRRGACNGGQRVRGGEIKLFITVIKSTVNRSGSHIFLSLCNLVHTI